MIAKIVKNNKRDFFLALLEGKGKWSYWLILKNSDFDVDLVDVKDVSNTFILKEF